MSFCVFRIIHPKLRGEAALLSFLSLLSFLQYLQPPRFATCRRLNTTKWSVNITSLPLPRRCIPTRRAALSCPSTTRKMRARVRGILVWRTRILLWSRSRRRRSQHCVGFTTSTASSYIYSFGWSLLGMFCSLHHQILPFKKNNFVRA